MQLYEKLNQTQYVLSKHIHIYIKNMRICVHLYKHVQCLCVHVTELNSICTHLYQLLVTMAMQLKKDKLI